MCDFGKSIWFKIKSSILIIPIVLFSVFVHGQSIRTVQSLDGMWKFSLTQTKGDTAPEFDDSQFEVVNVPHSWPAEGHVLPNGGFRAQATYRRISTLLLPGAVNASFCISMQSA